jgi:hypothetical protein
MEVKMEKYAYLTVVRMDEESLHQGYATKKDLQQPSALGVWVLPMEFAALGARVRRVREQLGTLGSGDARV